LDRVRTYCQSLARNPLCNVQIPLRHAKKALFPRFFGEKPAIFAPLFAEKAPKITYFWSISVLLFSAILPLFVLSANDSMTRSLNLSILHNSQFTIHYFPIQPSASADMPIRESVSQGGGIRGRQSEKVRSKQAAVGNRQ
jgi:hypothetical protein